jgi:RNA polymerase sigma-70 factor (ECF subfamily)
LFAEHGRMVLGLCRLLLRDPTEAEDATQQVFLSAHRAVLRGSLPREPHAWLAAIARNECRGRIHARMREPLALPELPSDLPDPLAAAIRATDLEAIWAAISSLPRRQRRALVLRELGGLSYHELGRALGVSQSSVESLLFRARQQVRALVAAATPLALRDDLSRLIPGFDPGSAGLIARTASLPITLKLATAAVGVCLVTTGATQLPEHDALTRAKAHSGAASRPRSISPPAHAANVLVTERTPSPHRTLSAQTGEREHPEPRGGEEHSGKNAEPQEPEHVQAASEPAEVEPPQLDSADPPEGHGGGGSSNPGPGSPDSGSDHPGSSGSDSSPDSSDR